MSVKLGKGLNYNKGLQQIKSNNPSSTCLDEVTWQIKYVISLLPQDFLSLNVAKW